MKGGESCPDGSIRIRGGDGCADDAVVIAERGSRVKPGEFWLFVNLSPEGAYIG